MADSDLAGLLLECVAEVGSPMASMHKLIIDDELTLLKMVHQNGETSVVFQSTCDLSLQQALNRINFQRMRLDNTEGRKASLEEALRLTIFLTNKEVN